MSILSLLEWDSFASIWFWVILFGQWIMTGLHVLGVPVDVLEVDHPEAKNVIRFRVARHIEWIETIPLFLGVGIGCLLGCLVFLAIGFQSQLAQAILILTLPKCIAAVLGYRCAKRIRAASLTDQSKALKKLHLTLQIFGMGIIMGATVFAVTQHLHVQF